MTKKFGHSWARHALIQYICLGSSYLTYLNAYWCRNWLQWACWKNTEIIVVVNSGHTNKMLHQQSVWLLSGLLFLSSVIAMLARLAPLAVWTKRPASQVPVCLNRLIAGWLCATTLIHCLYISLLARHSVNMASALGWCTNIVGETPSVALPPAYQCVCINKEWLVIGWSVYVCY